MKKWITIIHLAFFVLLSAHKSNAQFITNVPGRSNTSLNGTWKVIIDAFDVGAGDWTAIWKDRKPVTKTDFVEYSFDGGPELEVPGDFNSQLPELKYYESTVWYKKTFKVSKKPGRRLFIYFGAVNYKADVYINSQKIGSHEGGFTPFQFEITGVVNEGSNTVIVRVNNIRAKDGIPGIGYDWFNYGGITRDVSLIETPASFIEDYFIQLQKGSDKMIGGWIKINGIQKAQNITVQIPEAKIIYKTKSGEDGLAHISFPANLHLWDPGDPKLYKVMISSETDTVTEEIGFRTIAVKGTSILLNNKPVFLKGVNIHEEIPQRQGRAYSEADALQLLSWTKELGCNFVRLAHYPHNEHTIRMAEKMGLMVWEEIPVYQGIDFANAETQKKMNHMLDEMISRDKNSCATIIWSMSNETRPSKERYDAIAHLITLARSMDSTRLISSAINSINYNGATVSINDSLCRLMDVVSVNEYFGWYRPWPAVPGEVEWRSDFNKPLIMSEFGGEALYGNTKEPKDAASSWSEEYQEQLYKDQLKMLNKINFLAGTCPWILADFRSPVRMLPVFQNGWNRKGLISDKGLKKKAWYVMKGFYEGK